MIKFLLKFDLKIPQHDNIFFGKFMTILITRHVTHSMNPLEFQRTDKIYAFFV